MSGDARSRRRGAVAVGLVALAAVLFAIEERAAAFHGQAFMQPDSVSYLEANVARAPLYPLVLRGVSRLTGGLGSLGLLQHLALMSAGAFLSYSFAVVFGRPLLAAALAASILANPQIVSYAFAMLPEALFIAVLMAHLACAAFLASAWRPAAAAWCSVTAATLALIKPTGFAVVAGLAVLAVVHRAGWRRLAWLAGPCAAVLLLACLGNYVARGLFATEAQGGYSRAAYVGQLIDPSRASAYPEAAARIAARTAPIRAALDALPTIDTRYLVAANEYHAVEAIVRDEIVAEIGRERGSPVVDPKLFPSDPNVIRRLDEIAATLAREAIAAHPGEYARLAAANGYGLWWLPLVRSNDGVAAARREIDSVLSRFPVVDRSPIAFRPLPVPAYIVVRAGIGAVALCGLLSLVSVWSSSRLIATVGFSGVLVHGSFLLVSLAQPGLPRYALAMWPASMLLLFGTIACATRRIDVISP